MSIDQTIASPKQEDTDETSSTDDSTPSSLGLSSSHDASIQAIRSQIEKQKNKFIKTAHLDNSDAPEETNDFEPQTQAQLEQEKKFTEKELLHLEDRLKHTQQTVEQMKQYYILKHYEMDLEQQQHNQLEDDSGQRKKNLLKELKSMDQQVLDKTHALKQLEESPVEFNSIKVDISSTLNDMEEKSKKRLEIQGEMNKLQVNKRLKQLDLEHLFKQIEVAKSDLDEINQQQKFKQEAFDQFNEMFEKSLEKNEGIIEQQNQFQYKIELQHEINALEESTQRNAVSIKNIETELLEHQQKHKMSLIEKKQELIQLDERLEVKQQELQDLKSTKEHKLQIIKELDAHTRFA